MFEERLKELRKAKNVSQSALASLLNVTQQAVGKWETGRSAPDMQTLTRIAEFFAVTIDFLLGAKETRNERSGEFPIPIIGTVKAGYNALAFEEDYGVEYACVKNPEEYFFLIVKGDSMEPRIQNGDLALVHRQQTLNDGELGVMIYGDNCGTLKKFIRKGNTVILQPFNSNYQPQIIVGEDLDSLYIAGKVVETKAKW